MTDLELKDVRQLVLALKRVEWVEGKCPWCSRRQAYGQHVCSCPRRLALRTGERLVGGNAVAATCEAPAIERFQYWPDNGVLDESSHGDYVKWEDVLKMLGATEVE